MCKFRILGVLGDQSVGKSGSYHDKQQQFCPLYWDPICGSNSQTYRNRCQFEKAKLYYQQHQSQSIPTIAYLGTCRNRSNALSHIIHVECPLQCSSTSFRPVCASNGVTFINNCYLKMFSCQLARHGRWLFQSHHGPCLGTELTSPCDQNCSYAQMALVRDRSGHQPRDIPICTSHGHLYLDPCQFKKSMCHLIQHHSIHTSSNQHREMIFYGRCSSVSELTGIDFITHYNQDDQKHNGKTLAVHCRQHCINTIMPVCSQNGREYPNYCQLKKWFCRNGSRQHPSTLSLSTIQHWHSCNTSQLERVNEINYQCPKSCRVSYDPVCGSDQRVYINSCFMRMENCSRSNSPDRPKIYLTRCHAMNYDNTLESDGLKDSIKPKQYLLHDAQPFSPPSKCPICENTYQPVCSSENINYVNRCIMNAIYCRFGWNITNAIKYHFACPEAPLTSYKNCWRKCGTKGALVCASDGTMYINRCNFKIDKCAAEIRDKKTKLRVNYYTKTCHHPVYTKVKRCQTKYNCQSNTTFAPICATTGETFVNFCAYKIASCVHNRNLPKWKKKMKIAYQGRCAPGCDLTDKKPVCGNDGRLYYNLCVYQYERRRQLLTYNNALQLDKHYRCLDPICSVKCNKEEYYQSKQICASDGKWYFSQCQFIIAKCKASKLKKSKLKVVRKSFCKPLINPTTILPSTMPTTILPSTVPATQPINTNLPIATIASTKPSNGLATKIPLPSVLCKSFYRCKVNKVNPLCGSNGQTYSNICFIRLANCTSRYVINIAYRKGTCQQACQQSCKSSNSTKDNQPICASNGQTYSNQCQFQTAVCQAKLKKIDITKMYNGQCDHDTLLCGHESKCKSDQSQPICASDGKTYSNLCYFTIAQCKKKINSKNKQEAALSIKYTGKCLVKCPNNCGTKDEPICGSDGVLYLNRCQLRFARCYAANHHNKKVKELNDTQQCTISQRCLKKAEAFKNAKSDVICASDVKIVSHGKCPIKCRDIKCDAFRHSHPICGKNQFGNQNFPNWCDYYKEKCLNPSLQFVKYGECDPADEDPVQQVDYCNCQFNCDSNQKATLCKDGRQCITPCFYKSCQCGTRNNNVSVEDCIEIYTKSHLLLDIEYYIIYSSNSLAVIVATN
ncbi:uncharacterized protein TRIADDRAFT_61048 [Trichoplax adhaerens]|uniref:Kazal-like domain-containing protein n=1 Tax=Trichoplax adhaerens TaxID=10228 RepID=B3S9W4_TRIAD|nr:hypothetical protein TRIADDRAFT_61048 [Trichoplax adhaerens]EDV20406.1 hypothetical protein TRIADDRAFT_61048 [Trichoplax adhaerens]|eukprot:XP_002117100.1 hypothetical protein TRIADDRAFT_61048 [Trichoplax adhaerens]